MKVLIDMNLSPSWVDYFSSENIEAVHWSSIGNASAPDHELFDHARQLGYVIFTHDLDFGSLLALTQTHSPSVIQVRTQDVLSKALAGRVLAIIRQYETVLEQGALVVVDETRERVRILPLRR